MSGIRPYFWSSPLRFTRWAAHEKPALFWGTMLGAVGLVMVPIVPPLRHRFGDLPRESVPFTYPIPRGPRNIPEGFDDD